MPVYNHIPKIESDMEGATEENNGKSGLVPAAPAGDANRALMANGTWKKVVLLEENRNTKVGKFVSFYTSDEQTFPNGSIMCNEDGTFIFGAGISENCLNSFANGTGNELANSDDSFVTGANNQMTGTDESFISGSNNKMNTTGANSNNFISGYKNEMSGEVDSSGIIGEGLKISPKARTEGVVIVGKYNDYHEDSAFEVGAGIDDATRANAFRVTKEGNLYSDGNIIQNKIVRSNIADAGSYFAPVTTENTRLGHGNAKWSAVYAASPEIVTSDKNLKKNISSFTEAYEKLFFDLQPSTFKFKEGDSNRIHSGFISQDVEEALERNGLSALDFAGFCKDKKTKTVIDENSEEKEIPIEGEYLYSLRYEEFIALNTHMIQKLYVQVNEMQEEMKKMRAEINRLKGEM